MNVWHVFAIIGWEVDACTRAGTVAEVEKEVCACALVVIGWEVGGCIMVEVETQAWACAFASAESASGLVHLPDRSPLA